MSELPVEDEKAAPQLLEMLPGGGEAVPLPSEKPEEELPLHDPWASGSVPAGAEQITASLSDWMADIPDTVKLTDMSIPGTHESCALHDTWSFGYATCQEWSLPQQLAAGVRFVDIRCRVVGSGTGRSFAVHHGDVYQKLMFGDAMQQCWDFLQAHPGETILMRLSQTKSNESAADFRWVFENSYAAWLYRFHIATSVPALGQVRGKIVLMTRDPYIGGLNLGSSPFDTQDYWDRPTIAYKKQLVSNQLAKAINAGPSRSQMFMNYTSANSGPQYGVTPLDYAKEVNPHTLAELNRLYSPGGRTGVVAMDFINRQSAVTGAIIRMNRQPSDDIALVAHNGSAWSGPILPWPGSKTNDAPALAMHGGNLYCAVRGLGNQIFVSRRETNGQWTGFGQVPGVVTQSAPALASFNGRLYLTYRVSSNDTNNNSCGVRSSTRGDDWTAHDRVNVTYTTGGGALASHLGRLWHAVAGQSRSIMVGSFSGSSWWLSADTKIHQTTAAPALAAFQNKLYMAYRGLNNQVFVTVRDDRVGASSPWPAAVQLPGSTTASPALAVRGNTLYCAVRGGDDRIYLSSHTGSGWSAFSPITTADTVTRTGPALAAPDATDLYLAYRAVL
ncbi:1-phosphatidylinositol phosphodiesterase precursor [Streptomyces sp. ADI95-16]|uniref:phosphatidylinositol-specific phospholipase C domain-containing protein n=1 Tax=Streptomyces sp. ADI95-16 TaxID=1522758 RepID=UPI000F3A8F4E|nr:1-phosphatidylinositol phosphodiesterase precursor [Streptomyces sp. ADI95-16]